MVLKDAAQTTASAADVRSCNPAAVSTTGSIASGQLATLTVASAAGIAQNDRIEIVGAGSGGGLHRTYASTVSGNTITLAAAAAGQVSGAKVRASRLTSIVLDAAGSGYTSAPSVTIAGDGSGATASASLAGSPPSGLSSTITITNPGTSYTAASAGFTLASQTEPTWPTTEGQTASDGNMVWTALLRRFADQLLEINNVRAFGAKGDGNVDDAPAIQAAIDSLPSGNGTVAMPPGTYKLGSNLTVPSSVTLELACGALLEVGSGISLTVLGTVSAGPWRVFSGAGSVQGPPRNTAVQAEWFGAMGDYLPDLATGTDSTSALLAAIRMTAGGWVTLGEGAFLISGRLDDPATNPAQVPVRLAGCNPPRGTVAYDPIQLAQTLLYCNNTAIVGIPDPDSSTLGAKTSLKGLRNIKCMGVGGALFAAHFIPEETLVENVYFQGFSRYGVWIRGGEISSFRNLTFYDCGASLAPTGSLDSHSYRAGCGLMIECASTGSNPGRDTSNTVNTTTLTFQDIFVCWSPGSAAYATSPRAILVFGANNCFFGGITTYSGLWFGYSVVTLQDAWLETYSAGGEPVTASASATASLSGGAVQPFSDASFSNYAAHGSGYPATTTKVVVSGSTTGSPATVKAIAGIGVAEQLTVTGGGSGYTTAPNISFSGGGIALGTASATVVNGQVQALSITNAGDGYLVPPDLIIDPPGGGGTQAAAVATISGGRLAQIFVTSPGSGYSGSPAVQIKGGGIDMAAATATLGSGSVTAVTVDRPGAGYTTAPAVAFSGGGGSGASAMATLTSSPVVSSLYLAAPNFGGSGYNSAPSLEIMSGPLSLVEVDCTLRINQLHATAGRRRVHTQAFTQTLDYWTYDLSDQANYVKSRMQVGELILGYEQGPDPASTPWAAYPQKATPANPSLVYDSANHMLQVSRGTAFVPAIGFPIMTTGNVPAGQSQVVPLAGVMPAVNAGANGFEYEVTVKVGANTAFYYQLFRCLATNAYKLLVPLGAIDLLGGKIAVSIHGTGNFKDLQIASTDSISYPFSVSAKVVATNDFTRGVY